MPIYEYECLNNKHRFEVIQKFTDPPVEHCTVCGEPVQKLLSSPAIQFKGTGWYITDYARKGSSEGSNEGSKEGSKETSKESKPSETTKTDTSSADSNKSTKNE